jgi:hypothetical protein
MKTTLFVLWLCLMSFSLLWGQPQRKIPQPKAKIEKMQLNFQGREVKGRKLTVSSQIPIPIEQAWELVQTPALLAFVAKGRVRFKPVAGDLPAKWAQGDTVSVKMRLYGLLPFGGTHHLFVASVNPTNYTIQTREWDRAAKVWNHRISMQSAGEGAIWYQDEIIVYGGVLTGLIARWARSFYQHRQKRWHRVGSDPRFSPQPPKARSSMDLSPVISQ